MQSSIKNLRRQLRFSIREMACVLGVSVKDYRQYERRPHRMPATVAIRLAEIGHRSVDEIFFG